MLEGKIEAIVKDNRNSPGLMLVIWVPLYNVQFKQVDQEMKIESDEEVKKRKSEWEHLHYGKVMISQGD